MSSAVRHEYQVITGDTTVTTKPAILVGYWTTTAAVAGEIWFEDGNGGTVVINIPSGTGQNTGKTGHHIYMHNGIHVDYQGTATGTIRVDYHLA